MSETPRLPSIGEFVRSLGRLVAVEDVVVPPPPPEPQRYVFEEVSARVEIFSLKGVEIGTRSTFNEFYGAGTAVTNAIEAQAAALAEELGPGVVVVVRRIVAKRAYVVARPIEKGFYHPDTCRFNDDKRWYRADETSEIVWRSAP